MVPLSKKMGPPGFVAGTVITLYLIVHGPLRLLAWAKEIPKGTPLVLLGGLPGLAGGPQLSTGPVQLR